VRDSNSLPRFVEQSTAGWANDVAEEWACTPYPARSACILIAVPANKRLARIKNCYVFRRV
jgi:hypothetical protein